MTNIWGKVRGLCEERACGFVRAGVAVFEDDGAEEVARALREFISSTSSCGMRIVGSKIDVEFRDQLSGCVIILAGVYPGAYQPLPFGINTLPPSPRSAHLADLNAGRV